MKRWIIVVVSVVLLIGGIVVATLTTNVDQSRVDKFLDDLTLVCKETPPEKLMGDIICLELLLGNKSYVASLIKTPQDMELFEETFLDRCKASSAEVCDE